MCKIYKTNIVSKNNIKKENNPLSKNNFQTFYKIKKSNDFDLSRNKEVQFPLIIE